MAPLSSNRPIVVILIHGYKVVDPRRTVGKLRPYFESLGCLVENYTYGYWPIPAQITKRNPQAGKEVAKRCKHWRDKGYRVFVAAHSNGCVIARMACEIYHAPIERVLAINPALRKHLNPNKCATQVIVAHNQGDRAVVLGGWLGFLSKRIFPKSWTARPWGQMGQDGYTGRSRHVSNIDTGSSAYEVKAWGHSDVFSKEKSSYWLGLLAGKLIKDIS